MLDTFLNIGGVVLDAVTTAAADPIPDTATGWLGVLVAVNALATAIVNLTPTPKDNEILAKAYRVVEFAAGIFTRRAKQ